MSLDAYGIELGWALMKGGVASLLGALVLILAAGHWVRWEHWWELALLGAWLGLAGVVFWHVLA